MTKFFIEHFGRRDLFGRDNYEYYARLTGRILKVEDEYIFFTYPPAIAGGGRGAAPRSADDTDASLDRLGRGRSESPGATGGVGGAGAGGGPPPGALEKTCTGSLEIIPENCPLDPAGRLSISLDDQVRRTKCSLLRHNRQIQSSLFSLRTCLPRPRAAPRPPSSAPAAASPSRRWPSGRRPPRGGP